MNDLRSGFTLSLYLIVSIQFWGMACTLVNDLSDKIEDYNAGKKRWAYDLSPDVGFIIVAIFFVIGFASILFSNGAIQSIIAYAAAIIVGSFYSLRPVRLKNRGILGLFAYGLLTAIVYVLVPWMAFASTSALMPLLFIIVFLDKWVNLHFHQIIDYSADLNAGNRTYAVNVGLERTRRTLRIASLLASLSMMVTLVFIVQLFKQEPIWRIVILATSIVVVVAVGMYTMYMKKRSENLSDLMKELPWTYLGLTYLLFRVLPPVIFTHLAIKEPVIWILGILSLLSLLGESLYTIKYKYE